MKILYLHGLNSRLHEDRRECIELYSKHIYAPSIDYMQPVDWLGKVLEEYADTDFVIGSSAGGLLGYYVSISLQRPALLFNPALNYRKEVNNLPSLQVPKPIMHIVMGALDKDVPAKESLRELRKDLLPSDPVTVHWKYDLAHSIPINVFQDYCRLALMSRAIKGESR
ncbi:MAG: YqiA/YcfP family alpha/beta fold hydrolase [Weeksellaceae bacterium]|nr:YqiA/YcfP family alpha/beta fold hydrolase [Weeksellaceae bacterium]